MGEAGSGYRDLVAWQKGMAVVSAVYRASQTWPREELYGLTGQVVHMPFHRRG